MQTQNCKECNGQYRMHGVTLNQKNFFSEEFTRDRFLQIFWMLHLHKNGPEGRNTC